MNHMPKTKTKIEPTRIDKRLLGNDEQSSMSIDSKINETIIITHK